MTSLHVICGLALPPTQNPGYVYALNHVQYAYQIPVVVYIGRFRVVWGGGGLGSGEVWGGRGLGRYVVWGGMSFGRFV